MLLVLIKLVGYIGFINIMFFNLSNKVYCVYPVICNEWGFIVSQVFVAMSMEQFLSKKPLFETCCLSLNVLQCLLSSMFQRQGNLIGAQYLCIS